uniref:Uncharacterized protein n=1 Tax=Macrostomum lignano TaxID=282301 RepID=A0A1I8FZH9_9PLAT
MTHFQATTSLPSVLTSK